MNIRIERAVVADVSNLIEVQNKAFLSDYLLYGECPGYNRTYESMKNSVENCYTFKVISGNTIVGDVIVKSKGNGDYCLGSLCIIPECENIGNGQKVMNFIFEYFSDAKHWCLETPADKTRNHYFYKKLGFNITKKYMDGVVEIVLFEKSVQ